ncbi:hypothetical protein Bca52824_093175 [Brassica carinata]|uniref:Peptidase A1 domain-containing protein n=1 Tax=Brassica carinata TaxID=52824 RepID=A0A8X7P7Y4_BRACI|nr:hypothetical protein Bca52824_093175 [Brassica carinata]
MGNNMHEKRITVKMAIHFTSFLRVFIIALSFASSIVLLSASPSLVLKIIHPSQIYPLEHASSIEEASFARLDYLQAMATGDVMAHLSPSTPPAYLVNISIGSPPVMQLLHMDTGSNLLWLQCHPCIDCYTQSLPIFDPSKSYSYLKESCKTDEFSVPELTFDAKTNSCRYFMQYMDGTESKGTLAKETLTFSTIYGESSSASLSDVVFGCGHENYGKPQQGTGVLGLGSGNFSLVHRFGSKFSYCLGNLNDLLYPYNVLVIGDSGDTLGYTTQLEIENGLYYVKVEAISLGGSLLPIEPWVFQRKHHNYASGTIIDTGTSLTMLAREAYEPLKEHIEDIFDGRFASVHVPIMGKKYYKECYKGDFERDLLGSGFPLLTFHFSDGAELSLDNSA